MRFAAVLAIMGAAFALSPAVVQAETLHIEGTMPAENDAAAGLSSMVVERFGGEHGSALSLAIEDALRDAYFRGEPYFRILPPGGGNAPDGTLRGEAYTETDRSRVERERRVCVEEDDRGKCIKRETRKVECRRTVIGFVYSIRLIAYNGNLLHSEDAERTREHVRCPGDDGDPPRPEQVAREFSRAIADEIRGKFVPAHGVREVRVMESRDGLRREDRDRFREAVRLTKQDESAACAVWEALLAANPDHASTVFNIGLCAERRDERDEAARFYRRTLELKPRDSYPLEGLGRLEGYDRADRQLAAHFGA